MIANKMTRKKMILSFVSLPLLALALMLLPQHARSTAAQDQSAGQDAAKDPVPAYHNEVPSGLMPATLAPETFTDATVQNAYALAAKIKKVLYQQPCYCYCDRHAGHGSLLDCYTGKHAADCGVCLREGLYAYEQTKKGKTPAQIRDGIEKGEWKTVDMTKYQTPITAAK
jgi:Protein of unknown function with PCYCGC motif